MILKVVAVVWVPAAAQVVIPEVVAAGVVGSGSCDMAMQEGGMGSGRQGGAS
jgi:hypothetical protein